MSLEKKILFVGYDFEQKYYRGISHYSKAVVKACKALGLKNYILTSAKYHPNKLLFESLIKKKIYNPTNYTGGRKSQLLYLLKDFLCMHPYSLSDQLLYENNLEKLAYLNDVSGFVNKHSFYDITVLRARLGLTPSNVSIKDFEYVFATSPMYIRSRKAKMIQTLHDVIPILSVSHQVNDNAQIFYARIKKMIENSDAVVSVSEFSKKEVLSIFPEYEKKIYVTHQPVPVFPKDLSCIANTGLEEAVLAANNLSKKNYLFYVGYIEKRKNIGRMIQAYLALKSKVDVPLVLAGELDSSDEELKRMLQNTNKEKSNILYLGYVSNLEKIILLKNARAFVFPSLYEGFGLPPIEAFQLQTPVLTSNVTSLPEVCGDAAVYVDPYDFDSMIHGLQEVASNESLCNELIKKGNKRVDLFSMEKYQKRLNNVLTALE